MSFDLLLDSSLAKLENGGERNVSPDFTIKFHPPIELGSGKYKAGTKQTNHNELLMVQHRCFLQITTKFAGERKLKRGRP